MTVEILAALGWMLAGAGWAVAILALFLALRFRADWAEVWRTAWLLRQQGGWAVPGEVQTALTQRITVRPGRREPAAPPALDPQTITLSDPILRVVAETGELWHQEEMADTARQMLAAGASEAEVVNELREMLKK
jgi:hypothetical protein